MSAIRETDPEGSGCGGDGSEGFAPWGRGDECQVLPTNFLGGNEPALANAPGRDRAPGHEEDFEGAVLVDVVATQSHDLGAGKRDYQRVSSDETDRGKERAHFGVDACCAEAVGDGTGGAGAGSVPDVSRDGVDVDGDAQLAVGDLGLDIGEGGGGGGFGACLFEGHGVARGASGWADGAREKADDALHEGGASGGWCIGFEGSADDDGSRGVGQNGGDGVGHDPGECGAWIRLLGRDRSGIGRRLRERGRGQGPKNRASHCGWQGAWMKWSAHGKGHNPSGESGESNVPAILRFDRPGSQSQCW